MGSEEGTRDRQAESPEELRKSTAAWTLLAVGITGVLVGWITGISESPLGSVVLPLIFAIVAGAGGFHFSSSVRRKKIDQLVLRDVAQATVVFMVLCAVGMHLGILQRIGEEPPKPEEATAIAGIPAGEFGKMHPAGMLQLVALDQRLRLAGVGAEAVNTFDMAFIREYERVQKVSPQGGPSKKDLEDLDAGLKAATVAVENAKQIGHHRSGDLKNLADDLPGFIAHLDILKKFAENSRRPIPKAHYQAFLDQIDGSVESVTSDWEAVMEKRRLTPVPQMDYLPLYGLRLTVESQRVDFDVPSTGIDTTTYEESLDKAIALSHGNKPPEEPAPRRRTYGIKP